MRPGVARALLLDAFWQVLDNRVFRWLALLVGFLVFSTFAIGARVDSLVLLFGWKQYSYADIFKFLGWVYPGDQANIALIQRIQEGFVDYFIGTVGIMFSVAATAFFVPRMLEKGAAETLLSKPVSRGSLLVSRYLAGLIFVAILSVVLVGGMHLGLTLSSGYSDPGFLWSIVTLCIVFAILHSLSIAVGVITRNTVAAILVTLTFFTFNGCVHRIWVNKESHKDFLSAQADNLDHSVQDADTFDAVLQFLEGVLNAAHYVLPKTGDAPRIAKMLRRSLSPSERSWRDPETGLSMIHWPEEFELHPGELDAEGVAWTCPHPEGLSEARLQLSWRSDEEFPLDPPLEEGERESSDHHTETAAQALRREVESSATLDSEVSELRTRSHSWRSSEGYQTTRERVLQRRMIALFWTEDLGIERRVSETTLFRRWGEDRVFRIDVGAEEGWLAQEESRGAIDGMIASLGFRRDDHRPFNPGSWYEERFGWRAPLAYNAFFSIGSSLAFALAVFLLGWWRLCRMDF